MYQKVFATWYPIDLYTACAVTSKRAEAYLRKVGSDSRHTNHLLFYVLLVTGCLATKSQAPQPKTLAKKLTANPVDDGLLKEALDIVCLRVFACRAAVRKNARSRVMAKVDDE